MQTGAVGDAGSSSSAPGSRSQNAQPRADVTAARLAPPHCDVDAMAEISASEATARVFGVRVEGRGIHARS